MKIPNLKEYDLIIINSSGGKDSIACIWEMNRIIEDQKFNKKNVHISHQDLKNAEWKGTTDLVIAQAKFFGYQNHVSRYRDKNGNEKTFLDYAEQRGMFPSSTARWCTSEFKRGAGARVVTALSKPITKAKGKSKVLYCFGFRHDESPARKIEKKIHLAIQPRLTTKKRTVVECYPIQDWNAKKVWQVINKNKLPSHNAYNLGMPRLSCVFCIYAPFDALVIAGQNNPKLLDEYIRVERKIKHTFQDKKPIENVRDAIDDGYEPGVVQSWVMPT